MQPTDLAKRSGRREKDASGEPGTVVANHGAPDEIQLKIGDLQPILLRRHSPLSCNCAAFTDGDGIFGTRPHKWPSGHCTALKYRIVFKIRATAPPAHAAE